MSSYLYHEKQDAALCGVHCLNNLLQGSYFNEIDLMQVARKLDLKERELMAEAGTDTTDFIKFAAEDSGNVALDGNFSISVLSESLNVWGLTALNIQSPDLKDVMQNPEKESAFICNLQSHWLAIRKLHGEWWDLNSINKEPEYKSELYLGMYLKQLQIGGYTIYVVRGSFPNALASSWNADGSPVGTNWVKASRRTTTGSTASGTGDSELEKAMRESLQQYSGGLSEEDALQAAIRASMNPNGSADVDMTESGGDELEAAIAMSLEQNEEEVIVPEEPEASDDTTTLVLKMPTGKRVQRRFMKSDMLGIVYAFVKSSGNKDFKLITNFPKKAYQDQDQTLEGLGLCPRAQLIVAPL